MLLLDNQKVFVSQNFEFTIAYQKQKDLITVSVTEIYSQHKELTSNKYQCKHMYASLPNIFKVLFPDNNQLFTFLVTLPEKSITFKSRDDSHYVSFEFTLLGRQKSYDLQVYRIIDNDATVKELQDKIHRLISENRKLTFELNEAKSIIENLNFQLKRAKSKIADYEVEVQILQIQSKKRRSSESINEMTMVQSKQSFKLALDCPEYFEILKLKNEERFKFVADAFNNSKFFLINGPKINLLHQFNNFHQVVSKQPLSSRQRSVVKIKINKSTKNNIYFGILKEERRKQKFTCQHQLSISYKLSGGKFLFQDGKQTGQQMKKIQIGQILNLLIDPIKYEVVWFVEGAFMTKRYLPEVFRNKAMYPFVSLHDCGDEVEFI